MDDDELREFTRALFKPTGNRLTGQATYGATYEQERAVSYFFKALTAPQQTPNEKDTSC